MLSLPLRLLMKSFRKIFSVFAGSKCHEAFYTQIFYDFLFFIFSALLQFLHSILVLDDERALIRQSSSYFSSNFLQTSDAVSSSSHTPSCSFGRQSNYFLDILTIAIHSMLLSRTKRVFSMNAYIPRFALILQIMKNFTKLIGRHAF